MDHGSAPSVVVEQEDVLAIVAPLRDVTRHTRRHDLGHPSHSVSKEWLLSHSSGAVPDLPDLPDLPPISPDLPSPISPVPDLPDFPPTFPESGIQCRAWPTRCLLFPMDGYKCAVRQAHLSI